MAQISGKINDVKSIKATLNNSIKIINVYPELESIIIEPKEQTQIFTPEKYGFDKITVNGIKLQQKEVIPSDMNQIIVADGGFNGLSEVMVRGDFNLSPENIVENVSIFGVVGVAKSTGAKITNGSRLFYSDARTDYINELIGLCENLTSMYQMFYNCRSVLEIDLSNINTVNNNSLYQTFYGCGNLEKLNINNLKTNNVTNMAQTFYDCEKLKKIDLNSFDTSNVTNMQGMFYGCDNLEELDLSGFDMSKVANVYTMFINTFKLKKIKFFRNLGKAYTSKSTNNSNYALRLGSSSDLDIEDLIDLLNNGLYDLNLSYKVESGGTLYRQVCDVGKINLAKLQGSEEGLQALANADAKGWNITGS